MFERERDFAIEECIVEVGAGCVGTGIAKPDAIDVRPVDGGQAHGAGFAAGVDFRALEAEDAELLAGSADGADFAVGGGVVVAGDAVGSFADDGSVTDDYGTERSAAAAADIFSGESDGSAHELRVRGRMHRGRERSKPVWHKVLAFQRFIAVNCLARRAALRYDQRRLGYAGTGNFPKTTTCGSTVASLTFNSHR